VSRGLQIDKEILFIIDGAKGLRKGIKEALGEKAHIQRCQWHKRENILSYLPESEKSKFRQKLTNAYKMATEEQALKELTKIGAELRLINESAYTSLQEGLEETLTVHKLKVTPLLRKSLATTNPIENLNSLVGQYTDRVDNWKNSSQRQRWVASALNEIEPELRRLRGYKDMEKLRDAMKIPEIKIQEKKRA
jgi:transposase-like protein